MNRRTRILVTWITVIAFVLFSYAVWPTPYVHGDFAYTDRHGNEARGLWRRNRFTNTVERCYPGDAHWR